MAVTYYENNRIWKLDTAHTSYVIGLSPEGYVGHVYYGAHLHGAVSSRILRMEEPPFTPSVNDREKSTFLDSFPMEYPAGGIGDYRESALEVRNAQGFTCCELLFDSYTVMEGKPSLPGLPASFGTSEEVTTLQILCRDPYLPLSVTLSYSVFPQEDMITRSVKVTYEALSEEGKHGTGALPEDNPLYLEKVFSASMDMDQRDFEVLTLTGSWAKERHIQRLPLGYGRQNAASVRGCSSHQEHPFLALVTPETTQETGEVYAMSFVYSGNFLAQAELSHYDKVRMSMGIHPQSFCWKLLPGESFQSPEVVMTWSGEGLGKMTRSYHDFWRRHLIRSVWKEQPRPVLINNWEATYFDFNAEKLIAIARKAHECGIEMLVMDDGWFGCRNNDDNSLGDWTVNEAKLGCSLGEMVEKIHSIGMKFGIWFEPEMISPDSDLYRAHPDWAIQVPGRVNTQSRAQYVLDLSRREVLDYVYEAVAGLLRKVPIDYVKWDMNRQISNLGSAVLPPDRMGELFHRYILGVYELQEKLVTEFPELLLENCAGGGGRFDPGMLYYSPQIWCSDDTDALERLRIQEGTMLVYPVSAMGSHVSDCPNHQSGRMIPFATRALVAQCGTFGYELDITKIPEEDRAQIPAQVERFHLIQELNQKGDYYRIQSWDERHPLDVWEIAAKDGSRALLTVVQVLAQPQQHSKAVRMRHLVPDAVYQLEGTDETYTGEELMNCGFLVRGLRGEGVGQAYLFVRQEQ